MSIVLKDETVEYVLAIESLIKIIRDPEGEDEYSNLVILLASLGFNIEEIDGNTSQIELLQDLCKRFSELELFEDE